MRRFIKIIIFQIAMLKLLMNNNKLFANSKFKFSNNNKILIISNYIYKISIKEFSYKRMNLKK